MIVFAESVLFLVLCLPMEIIFIGKPRGAWSEYLSECEVQVMADIFLLFRFVNSALNFVMYMLVGTMFRAAFLSTLRGWFLKVLRCGGGLESHENAANSATSLTVRELWTSDETRETRL